MDISSLLASAGHSVSASFWFVGIAIVAWGLDVFIGKMRKHFADVFLCEILRYTALSLAALDCVLVLHYAISSALTSILG